MGRAPSSAYTPKAPAAGVLYQVVRDHYETLRAEATRGHDLGLPRFIEEEVRGFLLGRGVPEPRLRPDG